MCAFLPCHKEIIAQKGKKKRESYYKSGIWGTNFEPRLQNVKLDYKTGTSVCNRPNSFYYYSIPKFLLDLVSKAAKDKENFLLLLILMIHCTEKRTNILFGYLLTIGDKIKSKEEEYKLRIISLAHWLFKIFNENEDYEKFKSLLLKRDLYIPERDSMYKRLFSDYREREMDLKDPRIQEFLKRNK